MSNYQTRLWKQIFARQISLRRWKSRDAVFNSLVHRIPLHLPSLDLQLGNPEWLSHDHVSTETLRHLLGKLGTPNKLSLEIFSCDGDFQLELMRKLPPTLEAFSLTMSLEEGVVAALARSLPTGLRSLSLDFRCILRGNLSCLLTALPANLQHLKLDMAEVFSDEHVPKLLAAMRAAPVLETLFLGMENTDLRAESASDLIRHLARRLHQLTLKMGSLDLRGPDVPTSLAEA